MPSDIVVQGAREHNLRSINVTLPRNQLICLTGVSGSGKSSLAFDTVYAEGQRRYVESLSSFARQFLGQMPKPEVDHISGLSPTISISQKTSGQNPRSTVGTITEIYDYLRVLYARVGQGHCPQCRRPITAQTREQIIERMMLLPSGERFMVLAPVIRGQKGEYRDLFTDLMKQGFVRARVDGTVVSLGDNLQLDRQMRHNIEVVVDRLRADRDVRPRLAEAVELALKLGDGNLIVALETGGDKPAAAKEAAPVDPSLAAEDADAAGADAKSGRKKKRGNSAKARQSAQPGDITLSAHYACTHCGLSFEPLSPQLFSFNSPQGMCTECDGLGAFFSFDAQLMVPLPKLSFKQGVVEIIGPWNDLGRWRRHVYRGVAETIERVRGLPEGTMLDTPWQDLDPALQSAWLWGTGEQHITFTWRAGANGQKYGGRYEGIIPDLLSKYRSSKSTPQIRQLEKYMNVIRCPDCSGERLNPQARAVTVTTADATFADAQARSLPEVCALPVSRAVEFFRSLQLDATRQVIATEVLKEISGRLGFLENVGLDYLSLDRTAPTLSGGESQRIRLAGQIGCGLVGVLYVLDEPSIGLHPRDNQRLIDTLCQLRDLGNTVVVVEHDEDTMRSADHLIDFGPGPGVRGGEVVAAGSADDIAGAARSLTGAYLSGRERIEVPKKRRAGNGNVLKVVGASHNNLKNIDIEIPLGRFVCVSGASGSGKSSLVNDILIEALGRDLNGGRGEPGRHERIEGLNHLDKMIAIDQSPIGRTPRSNPATYIKVFDDIRKLYVQLTDSKTRGYQPGRFSFNVSGGRCEACEGNGSNRLEMDFLAAVWVTCPVCQGHRFNRETLQVRFKGKSIADVLEMDIQQALSHFENISTIRDKLQTLHDVGLDYLKLGQPSPTLSGGEAQRIKLARELVKRSTGKTLYLLDEPTTGLHFADIKMLLTVLHGFVEAGNTVLVVEHNLDVIKTADWVIDLGPDGGAGGGQIVAAGTPEDIARAKDSHTGQALAPLLGGPKKSLRALSSPSRSLKGRGNMFDAASAIRVKGARQHNLKGIDVEIPRDKMTVCCGMSGSGKTSLAMDTIYAEGQRRYVESLSSYARQFVAQMQKPQLDHIEGLSPAIAIEQKHMGHTPRSTVGTVTEIYDYLRILLSRLGTPHCPACDIAIGTQTTDQIVDKILSFPTGTRLYLLAPLGIRVGERYETLWQEVRARGYVRIRVDGQTHNVDELPEMDRRRKHAVEVVIDRITVRPDSRSRIAESIEAALSLGEGVMHVAVVDDARPEERWDTQTFSQHFACDRCGRSFEPLSPHHFSFNSPLGWCPACEGLGTQTGANLSALIRDPKLSLADGAVRLWPGIDNRLFGPMLTALCEQTGVPADVPFSQLTSRQRRVVLYGCGEQWIDVFPASRAGKARRNEPPLMRFQYKGLYPALDEASKLSPRLRARLEQFVDEVECSTCGGSRLRDDAAAMRLRGLSIQDLCWLPLSEVQSTVAGWKLDPREKKIAGDLLREVLNRVEFLNDVGLEYLSLGRPAPTLSGGESQRIRLASQVGSGLCGVLYVLDEPTIGLHPRDNRRLLTALEKLRNLGNTLLLVEHDREVIAAADALLDFGPAAGVHGGQIVARGTPAEVTGNKQSVTGAFLSGRKAIPVPTNRRPARDEGPWLSIVGARHNNLREVSVRIPLGTLTAVTGVSGSGKSSLVEDVLYNALARRLHRAATIVGAHDELRGVEQINKVIRVDQQPLGNTPTSNPATYTGAFDLIRTLYAQLPDSKLRGFTARRFSFNAPGGRCEACEGNGQQRIEMHFLPDIWVECDTCRGRRYEPETLSVRFHGQSIADVLGMSCETALKLFENIPKVRRILQTLCDVGLGYVQLGQPAPTLSGGEAQRVKLAAELARPDTGQTLYLLDEPTTGLHFEDLARLLDVLHRLVDLGNTVVVIEHNLDVIKSADWVIDLGPEAGEAGGHVVAAGTPEQIVERGLAFNRLALAPPAETNGTPKKSRSAAKKTKTKKLAGADATAAHSPSTILPPPSFRSHTGEALAPVLEAGPHVERKPHDFAAAEQLRRTDLELHEVGRDARMPWETDGERWHTRDRLARNGQRARWDGTVLTRLVETIHKLGEFSPTEWSDRSVVEIAGLTKSHGWFFHALTGEEWLVKLKFRVAKRTFDREKLAQRIGMTPLNELDDLPVYGTDRRVEVRNLRGPWQEIELKVHSLKEIDYPEFWQFVEQAVAGFQRFAEKREERPEDLMPWRVLGQKWHLARKGFPPGQAPAWPVALLEDLCERLREAAPEGQFLWNNQQLVHLFVRGQREPWATLHTKRPDAIELVLNGPRGIVPLGRIAHLGAARAVVTNGQRDAVKLKFRRPADLARSDAEHGDLAALLREHLAAALGAVTP
ncbi:MAG: excinuclease ABC subunit UvrA [Planctomycetia bacterium]|nr:excinuclease ABC subunit UvrA [Planctomycetia bacterium]